MPRDVGAFSLLELLIVLALLALIATLVWPIVRPSAAERAARAYLHTVQTARLAAIAGRPGSVRWSDLAAVFEVRSGTPPCEAPVVDRLPPPDRVAVTRALRAGVVWHPDGTGRSCDGGGVYGGRVRFEDRRTAWDVVVASTGRLRIEAVP